MPPTIKDIARQVGKSITTVSRALNDYDDISPETKELVRRVAAEMGYRPNSLAQRLQKRLTDTLGLILPASESRASDPFFSEFITGVSSQASELGYDLLVSTRAPGNEELETFRSNVEAHRVDGFVLTRLRRSDPRVDYLKTVNFPFAAFGRVEGTNDFPYIDQDGENGMGLIIDHLRELGHTEIAVITSPPEFTFSLHRLRGVRKKIAAHNLELPEGWIRPGDLTQRGGYQQAQALLEAEPPPTAIVAFNDLMAIGAISAALDRGLKVGKDISITGFDDIPMAEHSYPSLTTLNQPIYAIGQQTCEMLVDILQEKEVENRHILLQPSLVVRRSTGPAPKSWEEPIPVKS